MKLPYRPTFTSEPKEGGRTSASPVCMCQVSWGHWVGRPPALPEAAQWVAPRTGFADSRSVCRTKPERTELRAGSAGVVSFPCLPAHLGSVITHSGRGHPGSPLMDVSREVVGPREEQDVGGRVW